MHGMVHCNVGLAELNYVDHASRPSKCPYSLDSRRLSPAHISGGTGGKGLNHCGTTLYLPYRDPGRLVGIFFLGARRVWLLQISADKRREDAIPA